MLKKLLWSLFMITTSVAVSEEPIYAITTGESDRERLVILNEIYNPFSCQFFEDCGIKKGARILELGCGVGLMSQSLAAIVGEEGVVLATDINQEQIDVAITLLPEEGLANLKFQQLSALHIDELTEQFDVVCARFLLVHFKEPQKILQKIKSVLKPGGKLIIEDITGNHTLHSLPHTEGMATLHHLDRLQFEIQQSDDQYFDALPTLLEKEGFTVSSARKVQPKLDTLRKRKVITFVSSIKEALINHEKITEEEYLQMLQLILELEQNSSVDIHYYELGQICATF